MLFDFYDAKLIKNVTSYLKYLMKYILTDTGTGIPVEAREKLFKPFAEIRDLTQGNGLGLPTCSLIAYKLNGTLTLDTDYKKGTRFILELHV